MRFIQSILESGNFIQFVQLLAALSFLIVLHEFGHFFFARLFKTRVEKFYLFFDFLFPFSNMLNFALWKKKKGDTEYGIGWFPLGGYVKIAGMVDESMDKEAMQRPPEPWEYRSKKAWQRLFIMLGGIIMNVIVAIFLYVIIFGVWGEEYIPIGNLKNGIAVDSIGQTIGLKNGDQIRTIDGKEVRRFEEIFIDLILHDDKGTIGITRNGKDTVIPIPDGTVGHIIKADRHAIISPRTAPVIDSVSPGTLAAQAGIKKGDRIAMVNNTPINFQSDFTDIKNALAGTALTITYYRNNQPATAQVTIPSGSPFGVMWKIDKDLYKKERYTPFQAVGRGISYTASRLQLYVAQFKLFRSKEVKAHEQMGGFISMGKMFAPEFVWHDFLMMTAFISVALAFMNFLPIPGLDGGYVIFLLFEMITGKQVSEKVMEYATTVGLVILLALMVYVNGLDILRLFHIK